MAEAMPATLLADVLDPVDEPEFTAIVRAAALITGCPIALVSVFDHERQWFKAKLGLVRASTALADSLCHVAARTERPLILPDLARDPHFSSHAAAAEGLRFYAGFPLRFALAPGAAPATLGALCVAAPEPHALSDEARAVLAGLAETACALIEARLAALQASQTAAELGTALTLQSRLNRQFLQAERIGNMGTWRLTLADNQVEWSEQVYVIHELAGSHREKLSSALSFYPPRARHAVERAVRRTIASGEAFDLELDLVTAKGNFRRVRAIGELEHEAGEAVAVIGIFQDITTYHLAEQTLQRAINTDDLTRVASRRAFNDYFEGQIARARQTHQPIALVMIDIDHFKSVNDSFGHAAGDEVLRSTAQLLHAEWLEDSFAARLGGDEFVLLVTDSQLVADIPAVAARLLGDLVRVVPLAGQALTVSVTCGICLAEGAEADRAIMLAHADAALYAAKRRQRGTAMIHGESDRLIWPTDAVSSA